MPIDVTTLTKPLPRSDLAQFLPSPRAIDAFENIQADVSENIPNSIAQIIDLTNELLAAPYIAWQASGTLENERLAAAGAGVTIAVGASDVTFSLTPSGVTAATYGSGSAIPLVTVDPYGRIVAASNVALNSDNVTEGAVNLFYTDARAQAAFSSGTGISYASGVIALDTASTRNTDHAGVILSAGAGLTGGGDISASRTLAVGAGTGISVNADDVAIDPAVVATLTGIQTLTNKTLTDAKATTTFGVGNATPAASGAGISFPATQSASTDANTLDDYEEGAWTPNDQSGAGLAFTITRAVYTKIGNLVTVQAEIVYPATASGAGAAIGGLPFTAGGSGAGSFYSAVAAGPLLQTTAVLYPATTAGGSVTNSTLSAGTVSLTCSYLV